MEAAAISEALARRLGPDATLGLVETFDVAQQECLDATLTQSADRFERRLVEETSKVRGEVGEVRLEMREGFGNVRLDIAGVRQDMTAQKFETLKWVFILWVGQIAAIIATRLR